jgi:hypothetical protein
MAAGPSGATPAAELPAPARGVASPTRHVLARPAQARANAEPLRLPSPVAPEPEGPWRAIALAAAALALVAGAMAIRSNPGAGEILDH